MKREDKTKRKDVNKTPCDMEIYSTTFVFMVVIIEDNTSQPWTELHNTPLNRTSKALPFK